MYYVSVILPFVFHFNLVFVHNLHQLQYSLCFTCYFISFSTLSIVYHLLFLHYRSPALPNPTGLYGTKGCPLSFVFCISFVFRYGPLLALKSRQDLIISVPETLILFLRVLILSGTVLKELDRSNNYNWGGF